jgi:hypothetical protein
LLGSAAIWQDFFSIVVEFRGEQAHEAINENELR